MSDNIIQFHPKEEEFPEPIRIAASMLRAADMFDDLFDEIETPLELALIQETLKETIRVLGLVNDDLQKRMVNNMDGKRLETPFGFYEKKKNIKRNQWHPEIRQKTLADVLVNNGLVKSDVANQTAAELLEDLPFTPGAPRIGKVRDLGFDPSEWCTEVDNGYQIVSESNSNVVREFLPSE